MTLKTAKASVNRSGSFALQEKRTLKRVLDTVYADYAKDLKTSTKRENTVVILDQDFLLENGTALPEPLVITDVSAAGTPTYDFTDDAINGEFVLTTESTSELQSITLSCGDELYVDPTLNPIMSCRIKIAPAGATFTADERVVVGLAANRNATLDSNTDHVWFRMEGANLNILVEADDSTTDTNDQDTGIDYVKGTYMILKIDMADTSDIKFYVDGVEQTGGNVSASAFASADKLQPYIEIQRDLGAEVNVVTIDYIYVEQDRA
jgi:hypothetical protein